MTPYELEERADGSVSERKSYVPVVASVSSALMFGAVAFWSVSISGGGSLAGGSPLVTVDTVAPNAPIINLVTPVVDSVTLQVTLTAFSGSQGDAHDSTRILVDSVGDDFTAPLVDSVSGAQTVDTVSYGFAAGDTVDIVALYRGAVGGWSDTSAVVQHVVNFSPGKITTLSVVGQADDSLKLQWVTVHNGKGLKAHHQSRYKNITGDTASFAWGGSQESTSAAFDSLGTNIGDTVSLWITGLTSGDTYEFGVITYRDDEGDGDPFTGQGFVYGAVPATGSGTTTGTTTSSPSQDTTDTPTLSLSATSDTSNIQMNGSGFVGGSQTHDSTRWRLDNNSDMSSPFHDVTSSGDLTSHTVTDNNNLTAGNTYYGTVQYFGSSDASAVSTIKSVVNTAPGAGPCGGPNEPPNMELLRVWNGTELVPSPWIEFNTSSPVKHSRVAEGGLLSGNSHFYRKSYPDGLVSGGGTESLGTGTPRFPASDSIFYTRFWQRPSANWRGHTAANKQMYFGVELFYSLNGGGSGTLYPEFHLQDPSPCCSGGTHVFNRNVGTDNQAKVERGVWTEIEIIIRENDQGVNNGWLKIFVNGVLVLHHSTETGDTHATWSLYEFFDDGRLRSYSTDAIWGGAGETLDRDQELDFDRFCTSGG